MKSYCLIALVGLLNGALALYHYEGDVPTLPIWYEKDSRDRFTAAIKIEAEDTFFLGEGCQRKNTCTLWDHEKAYNPEKYHGTKVFSDLPARLDFVFFTCDMYITPLYSPIINQDESLSKIAQKVIGRPLSNLEQDGVFALNFGSSVSNTYAMRLFFESVEKKVIIFRRGPFKQRLSDKQMRNTKGTFGLGEDTIPGCGRFVYQRTRPNDGWTIITDVQIGGKTYPKQTIRFSIDLPSKIPHDKFDNFEGKTEQTLPDLTFKIGSTSFTMKKENLVQYNDTNHSQMSLDIVSTAGTFFDLGKNFAKDYCIALRASSDLSVTEIGLAPIVPLNDDPKWERY